MGSRTYLVGFLRALFGHGASWWFSLFFTYLLGLGFFSDYESARQKINSVQGLITLPEQFPFWLLVVPFLIWVILVLAHAEGLKRLRAARITFDDPFVERSVPLYTRSKGFEPLYVPGIKTPIVVEAAKSILIGSNDIAKIVVRNCPSDQESGRAVVDAYVRVTIFDARNEDTVIEFDFPRWEETPKPGYGTNPSDHHPDAWNYRDLQPNMSRSTINFVLKSFNEDEAYGFTGASQLLSRWKDERLKFGPGNYIVRLAVYGTGLRRPSFTWLKLTNAGKGHGIEVEKTRRRVGRKWF